MKHLIFLSLFLSFTCFGQDYKKIQKLLGDDFVHMKGSSTYELVPKDAIFYPSWTKKGDTTGASNGVEYLLYEDSLAFSENEAFKFFKTSYVSNADWNEFIDRVVDSIMRSKIYVSINPSKPEFSLDELEKLFKLEKNWKDQIGQDADKCFIYLGKAPWNYDFDWRKKFDSKKYIPLIVDLYTRPNERFWRQNPLDERKFNVRLNYGKLNGQAALPLGFTDDYINVSKDEHAWAGESQHPFDLRYNLAHYYGKSAHFLDEPVLGLLGTQAHAYMIFLQEKYQQQINDLKLPYKVKVSLPTQHELNENGVNPKEKLSFITEGRDLTSQWQITNSEYKEFMDFVIDSIKREQIYYNAYKHVDDIEWAKMLAYKKVYFDEFELNWEPFDVANPDENRAIFNLNYDYNWSNRLSDEAINALLEKLYQNDSLIKHKILYTYYWVDHHEKSKLGDLEWKTYGENQWSTYECTDFYKACRDLEMSNGVRRHEDNSRFIIKEELMVYPGYDCRTCNYKCEVLCQGNSDHQDENGNYIDCGRCKEGEQFKKVAEYDFDSKPDELIQNITYHQALAYYNWKYQKDNVFSDDEDAIYEDLVPSEEEFKRAQSGEKMIIPAQQIVYPTPVFRYVVHVFKK